MSQLQQFILPIIGVLAIIFDLLFPYVHVSSVLAASVVVIFIIISQHTINKFIVREKSERESLELQKHLTALEEIAKKYKNNLTQLTSIIKDFGITNALLLNVEDTKLLECECQEEVWVATLTLKNDLDLMIEVISDNMNKGVKYHYVLPKNDENEAAIETLKNRLGEHSNLAFFHEVEKFPFTTETVLYDPLGSMQGLITLPVPESVDKRCLKITDKKELNRIRGLLRGIIKQHC